ncbi:MAG: hypothetical protein OXH13_11645 [Chloroflexi bacterium]|nr:hypothetical protein [Chloroflexota bacterium]MCY3695587.1 hypothetical protein [Chloroflexota bacterium]
MNPCRYRADLDRLARLADRPNPAHVRLSAACALVDELSPHNPRRDHVRRLLDLANPYEQARHKLRDLYDRSDSPSPPASSGGRCLVETEGGLPTEDDDPLLPPGFFLRAFFFSRAATPAGLTMPATARTS